MDKFHWEEEDDLERIPLEIRVFVVKHVAHQFKQFQASLPKELQDQIEKYWSQF